MCGGGVCGNPKKRNAEMATLLTHKEGEEEQRWRHRERERETERERERENVCLAKCDDNPPKLSTICCKE